MNEMLIIIVIAIVSLGLGYLVKVLRDKKIISQKDIDYAITIFGLTSKIAIQMNLGNIKNLTLITNIITKGLVFCSVNYNSQDIYNNTLLFVYDNCKIVGIELDEETKTIINQLIIIALNSGLLETKKSV